MPVVTPSAASIEIVKFVRAGAVGVADHQRQAQLLAALARQREADQAAAVARHEVDVLGAHLGGGHDEVAFVLAVLVVHDHDHPALPQVLEDLVYGVQAWHCGASRCNEYAVHQATAAPAPVVGAQCPEAMFP